MSGYQTTKSALIQAIQALDDQELGNDRSILVVPQRHADAVAIALPSLNPEEPSSLTEYEIEILKEGGYDIDSTEIVSMASKTAVAFDTLIRRSISVRQAAKRLNVHESRIRQRITGRPHSLYAFKAGGEWLIPLFQIRGKKLVHGIDKVIAVLDPALHPLEISSWFHNPDPDLTPGDDGEVLSPLDWLKAGHDPQPVIDLARDM